LNSALMPRSAALIGPVMPVRWSSSDFARALIALSSSAASSYVSLESTAKLSMKASADCARAVSAPLSGSVSAATGAKRLSVVMMRAIP
jgi:hypothetical protein